MEKVTSLGLLLMAVLLVMALFRGSASTLESTLTVASCNDEIQIMDPCIDYFAGKGSDTPPPPCCAAAATLSALVTTPDDRKATCQCFKDRMSSPEQLHRIELLRGACCRGLPIPSDPDQDCAVFL